MSLQPLLVRPPAQENAPGKTSGKRKAKPARKATPAPAAKRGRWAPSTDHLDLLQATYEARTHGKGTHPDLKERKRLANALGVTPEQASPPSRLPPLLSSRLVA